MLFRTARFSACVWRKKAAECGLLNYVIKEITNFVYNSQKKYEKPLAKIALCFYNKNRYYELVLKSR